MPSDWIPVTPENSGLRSAYETWAVDCPECGASGGIQMYGDSDDARTECHRCGETFEFALRPVEDDDAE